MSAQTAPSPLRERAGVRGNIRLWWSFRKARPLGASLRLAPAYRKRLSDLQPDQSIAESLQSFSNKFFASG